MKKLFTICALLLLSACSQSSPSARELNDRARASDRYTPAHSWSTPPSEMADVQEKRRLETLRLQEQENFRRRREDLERKY